MHAQLIHPRAIAVLLCALLGGCAGNLQSIADFTRVLVGRSPDYEDVKLDPKLRYLRFTLDGRVAILALGYVEPDPRGPVEVWYSGQREVVRMQNGRLAGVTGLPVEWRRVDLPAFPAWAAVARDGELKWLRVRDVMPGYRFGVKETLVLKSTPAPSRHALRDVDAGRLAWFEERVTDAALPKPEPLPAARYAVEYRNQGEVVVYGEQCVAPATCFTWQRWPAGS